MEVFGAKLFRVLARGDLDARDEVILARRYPYPLTTMWDDAERMGNAHLVGEPAGGTTRVCGVAPGWDGTYRRREDMEPGQKMGKGLCH